MGGVVRHYWETVASNVQGLRDRRGWSQKELARRASLSWRTVQNIETSVNEVDIRLSTLVRLAQALGVKPQDLMARKLVRSGRGRVLGSAGGS